MSNLHTAMKYMCMVCGYCYFLLQVPEWPLNIIAGAIHNLRRHYFEDFLPLSPSLISTVMGRLNVRSSLPLTNP